jgi:hypothetical protein
MLSAKRKSDGRTVAAYMESKLNAPFLCLECNEEVDIKTYAKYILKEGTNEEKSIVPHQ